jgi:hypothetical protein
VLVIELGFDPDDVLLVLARDGAYERFQLASSRAIPWPVPDDFAPPATGALIEVDARTSADTPIGNGSASYLARLVTASG